MTQHEHKKYVWLFTQLFVYSKPISLIFIYLYFIIQFIQEMEKEQNTPQFIKQLPWYAQDANGGGELVKIPSLEPKGFLQDWYNRGEKGFQSNSYRKGACENCGAAGHARKDCTERPRKLGAKFTNRNIASDDIVKDIKMNWQVKRDRWNGFKPDMYSEVIDQFNKYEEVRKKIKGDNEVDLKHDVDPVEAANLPSKYNKKEKFQGLGGVRNREDRAKYLYNLDLNSATFDPKSRTLAGQDQYLKQLSNLEAVGEKAALEEQDQFAFEQVQKHHAELSSSALPTLTQKIFKSVQHKRAGLNSGKMGQIMKKYGVSNSGPVIQVFEQQFQTGDQMQRAKRVIRSKYEEDAFINDHTTVWGSWYNKHLGWGYGCCFSNQKMSYCSGLKGRERALAKELKIKTQELRELQKMRELERQAEMEAHQEQLANVPQADNQSDEQNKKEEEHD